MIDHTGHPHPSTPKARALCRANGGTGSTAVRGNKAPPSVKKAAAAKPVVRTAQHVETGRPITREAAAKIMFGTSKAKVSPAKTTTVKRSPSLTESKIPVADRTRQVGVVTDPMSSSSSRRIPSNDRIVKAFNSGVHSSESLSGGAVAITTKVKFKDGSSGVQKVIEDLPDDVMADIPPATRKYLPTAKHQQDSEELGSLVARSLGLNAPEVYRVDEKTTVQEFKSGEVGIRMKPVARNRFYSSDHGLTLSVMDQIIGNDDRNLGNWLTDGDDLIPIDFSGSWSRSVKEGPIGSPMVRATDEFQRKLRDSETGAFKDNNLSPGDMDRIQASFESLRSEFQKRGRMEDWNWSMSRIAALRPYAKGTTRRIK